MAVIFLQGVLEDGSGPRAPFVPVNPRVTLQLTQDTTFIIRVAITNPAGVPVASQGVLRLTIKKVPQELPPLLQITGSWNVTLGKGIAEFNILASQLHEVPWGRYCYDVQLVANGSTDLVIPTSPVQLLPAVTTIS